MPQSATITILDKQKVSDKPKAPYKIQTTSGDVYKAWPDIGGLVRPGETYDIGYEIKASSNPEYADEKFIKYLNKSKVQASPDAAPGVVKAPTVDWAAKEEDIATLALFKTVFAATVNGSSIPSIDQCLDECRMGWRAHKARMVRPDGYHKPQPAPPQPAPVADVPFDDDLDF